MLDVSFLFEIYAYVRGFVRKFRNSLLISVDCGRDDSIRGGKGRKEEVRWGRASG